jgi:hypothetical protein
LGKEAKYGHENTNKISKKGSKSLISNGHKLSQPHFEASVRMKLTFPKMGSWSPPGLPQLQSSTTEGKTLHLEEFFIPLEMS